MNSIIKYIESNFDTTIEDLTKIIRFEKVNNVTTYTLSKRGKNRLVHEVNKESKLYRIQSILLNYFSSKVKLPDFVFGFQKRKSYYDFLNVHTTETDKTYYLKLDIKDFFTSMDSKKVVANLTKQFEKDKKRIGEFKKFLFEALTYNGQIPQGFKTSPFLSNYFFFIADLRIKKYCNKMNIRYSRYADDMIFSSASEKKIYSNRTIKVIETILDDFNFKLNKKKTKLSKNELSVNGYVIANEIKLSKNRLKEIKRILFIVEHLQQKKNFKMDRLLYLINDKNYFGSAKKITTRSFDEEYLKNYLSGYRSFLLSFLIKSGNNSEWGKIANKVILRIENAILIVHECS